MRFLPVLLVLVLMWSLLLLGVYLQSDSAKLRFTSRQRNNAGAGVSLILFFVFAWTMRDDAFERRMNVDPRAMAAVILPFMYLLWFTVPARGTGKRGVDRDEEEGKAFGQFAVIVALLVGLFYVVGPIVFPGL